MRRFLLAFATLALAMTGIRAEVKINVTNFPDENLRNLATEHDADENGALSDDELAEITEIHAGDIMNLKGAEHFKNLDYICLWYGSTENPSIASIDPSLFPKLNFFSLSDCSGVTSLDFSKNPLLKNFELLRCPNVSTLKLPASVEFIGLDGAKSLTSLDVSRLPKLEQFNMWNSGITDLDFSNHPAMSHIGITGNEDEKQQLNSLNLTNCAALENIDIRYTTIKSLTMKHLSIVRSLMLLNNDVVSTTIEDCAEFMSITCDQNVLGTLYLKDNPLLQSVNTENNQLQVLIADNCPKLGWVKAFNNRLMWLDLKDVKKAENVEESMLQLDNQQPSVQAVKLSPTETGLLVHDRFDVSRVLNLRAKGIKQTPRETTVDGIRYFVFYDNGPDTPNLVSSDCGYEYETKWPYPWIEGNSKDNNLPVTLNVTSWTKHQAFLKMSESVVYGKYAELAPKAPIVTRSQDYDGKITFSSTNEKVVKVNAETGELTVVGAGTASIIVSGTETDYRLAPTTSYAVIIEKASPVFVFEKAEVKAYPKMEAPANKLDTQMYDGTVVYTSSNDSIATVNAQGVVTANVPGEVTITAIGVETSNCYKATASYTVNISDADGIVNVEGRTLKNRNAAVYDLSGRRISNSTARKGVYVIEGHKAVKTFTIR